MEIPPIMLHKVRWDNLLVWVNQEKLDTASNFVSKVGLGWAFTKMGHSFDWGVLVSDKDKMVCNKYGMCVIPIHESLFYLIGFCLPFNNF